MDKNTVIGLILMVLVLIGFSWYQNQQITPPAPAEPTANTPSQQDNEKAKVSSNAIIAPSTVDSTAIFYGASHGTAQDIVLKNNKVEVTLSTKGASIKQVRLNEYKSYTDFEAGHDNPLTLYSSNQAALDMGISLKSGNFNLSDYYFTPIEVSDSTAVMQLQGRDSLACIELTYKLLPDNYLVNVSVRTLAMAGQFASTETGLSLQWKDKVAQQEKGFYFENMYSTLTYKVHGDDTQKLSEQESDEETAEGLVDWVAFKNQYFSSVLIAQRPLKEAYFKSHQEEEHSGFLKSYQADMTASLDITGQKATVFQFYFGPNNYRLLQSMDDYKITEHDNELQGLVYLGWPIVKWINRYFTLYVFDFFTRLGLPMGIVLLLITILLRVIVYVPTRKSYLSSAKMRVLKPKINEIAAKYPKKEDAMKRQQETMTLYSRYGVSPMGGCLPMLIQMPIWIAMFNFVPNAIELRQESFLWANDLSTYDSLISWDMHIWGLGNHLSLFCLLFCATNLLYSVMTMRQQRETMSGEQAEQMKIMQWMMMLMPLFFFFMFNKYSAGLNYYYFISLLFSALTMWWLRRTTDDKKLLAKLEAYYEEHKNKPSSGMGSRYEALLKKQEDLLKKQREAQQHRK